MCFKILRNFRNVGQARKQVIQMKKLVVLTGAGISGESGLKTFRGDDGLWEGYSVYDVATPEAWQRDPALVQDFYNQRRRAVLAAEPNAGHIALLRLEEKYEVTIVTQNIDNLHERAGSGKVVHLHGLITQSRSTKDPRRVYDIVGTELTMGETCELGSQLRPNIVWFGEPVPMIDQAAKYCSEADIFLIIGTSLQVYPAAGLKSYVKKSAIKILVDPAAGSLGAAGFRLVPESAGKGVPRIVDELLRDDPEDHLF